MNNQFVIQYVIQGSGQHGKERLFKNEAAMQKFIDKLIEKHGSKYLDIRYYITNNP